MKWSIYTGEYPPQEGGVADYTSQVARGLAACGDAVTVIAPLPAELGGYVDGVDLCAEPSLLDPLRQRIVRRSLDSLTADSRILVQYVPHALGFRGLNLPVARTIASARPARLDLMLHEISFTRSEGTRLRHRFLASVQERMARRVVANASRIFVAALGWERNLSLLLDRDVEVQWLPVPSNLPIEVSASASAKLRQRYAPGSGQIVGHFGTYGTEIRKHLGAVIPQLLRADPLRYCLLLGRGADRFRSDLVATDHALESRVVAPAVSDPQHIAESIAACDAMIQPYPDGVSGRRTTVMAALALGVPCVTTDGAMTESLWQTSGAVALADAVSPVAFASVADQWLRDTHRLAEIGNAGARLYRSHFAIEKTLAALRRTPD